MLGVGLNIWQRKSSGNLSFPATGLRVFDGDSKTIGLGSTAGNDYPSQVAGMTNTGATTWTDYSTGISSQRIIDLDGAHGTSVVDAKLAGATGAKILFFRAGINDFFLDSVSATVCKSRLDAYVANRIAAGWAKVYIFTVDDRFDFTAANRTEVAAYNAMLRTAYPTSLIDLAGADPRFANSSNSDIWSDGVHENDYGYNCTASIVVDRMVSNGLVGALVYSPGVTLGVAAGSYASYQSTTITSAGSLKISWTVDGTSHGLNTNMYTRAVPILSTRSLQTKCHTVKKYPKTESFAYTITTAFSPPATNQLFRFNKGGASGSSWPDASGNSRTGTLVNSPTLNGDGSVTFDGVNQNMTTSSFSSTLPHSIYMRAALLTVAADYRYMFDGSTAANVVLVGRIGPPVKVSAYAALFGPEQNPTLGTTQTFCFVVNGASSGLQVDQTFTTGNSGTNTLNGFTLASQAGGAFFANLKVYGVMAYTNTAHTQAERDVFHAWMLENWT